MSTIGMSLSVSGMQDEVRTASPTPSPINRTSGASQILPMVLEEQGNNMAPSLQNTAVRVNEVALSPPQPLRPEVAAEANELRDVDDYVFRYQSTEALRTLRTRMRTCIFELFDYQERLQTFVGGPLVIDLDSHGMLPSLELSGIPSRLHGAIGELYEINHTLVDLQDLLRRVGNELYSKRRAKSDRARILAD